MTQSVKKARQRHQKNQWPATPPLMMVMVDCRGDWIHPCYSGSRPWSGAVAEESSWSVVIRPDVLFFLPRWYLTVAVFLSDSWHKRTGTDDMGLWMGRPHFYNMLVSEWQTTSAWTGLTWQQYKGELLRVRGLNVMSIAEHRSASQNGVFSFYHWTFNELYQIICI
jgi:hypothetical protein